MWVFASFALMEVYSLFPYDHKEVRMFPLDPTLISFQTWVDYVAWRTKAIVDLFIIRALFPFYRKEMNVFIWLSVGYLIDYFVIYNNPVVKIGVIPISYTLFMLIIAAANVIIGFKKCQT